MRISNCNYWVVGFRTDRDNTHIQEGVNLWFVLDSLILSHIHLVLYRLFVLLWEAGLFQKVFHVMMEI